jgi:2-polyprenyl-6-methoxyphenol hydroxylase-like FAD-dependent oxidoreductase
MSSHSLTPLRIAIIGGGPGGLTLARILQNHGIRATVFEQETSTNSRFQCDSMHLHPECGFKALQVANLFDEFQKYARYEQHWHRRILDKHGVVRLDEMEHPDDEAELEEHGRPEIDGSASANCSPTESDSSFTLFQD